MVSIDLKEMEKIENTIHKKINNEIKDIKSSKRYELQSFNRENFIKSLDKKGPSRSKVQNLLSENNIMDDNSL